MLKRQISRKRLVLDAQEETNYTLCAKANVGRVDKSHGIFQGCVELSCSANKTSHIGSFAKLCSFCSREQIGSGAVSDGAVGAWEASAMNFCSLGPVRAAASPVALLLFLRARFRNKQGSEKNTADCHVAVSNRCSSAQTALEQLYGLGDQVAQFLNDRYAAE